MTTGSNPGEPCDNIPADLPPEPGQSYRPSPADEIISPTTGALKKSQSWEVHLADDVKRRESEDFEDPPGPAAYVLCRVIGRGGFGEVWEAVQTSLGRVIAVKRLRADLEAGARPDASRRFEVAFRQEAMTTACLDHPNVVPVYDLGLDERGMPLLAMKRVRGRPWDELLANDWHLPVADFLARHLAILVDVTQAVAFAHSRGILHRDLKPSQVMVGEYGEVLLMDWGLAVLWNKDLALGNDMGELAAVGIRHLDTAPNPAGTPSYMAPEQTENDCARLGPWTDVYLLGGILYNLLTGTPPHDSTDTRISFLKACEGEWTPPPRRAPGREIPMELIALCAIAMRADARERMQSATDFVKSLQDYLSGAGRRRDSATLTAEAEEAVSRGNSTGYREITSITNQLDRALALWPENTQAALLRERMLELHARAALGHGDLVLARVQAERLPEHSPVRTDILSEADAAGQSRETQNRQRRVAMVTTVALLLVVVVVGGMLVKTSVERAAAQTRAMQATMDRKLSETRAAESQRIAKLLDEWNSLRDEEEALAEKFSRRLPVPTTLDEATDPARRAATTAEINELLDERKRLAGLRSKLLEAGETIGERFGSEPLELAMAPGNALLATASTSKDQMAAYEAFRQLSIERPGTEPLMGMAVAAARAGDLTSATALLAEASQINRQSGLPDPGIEKSLLQLQGEAYRALEDNSQDYVNYFRSSLSILEPQWVEMSLSLAERRRELGDLAGAAEISSATLSVVASLESTDPPRAADAYTRIAYSQYLIGNYESADSLYAAADRLFARTEGTVPATRAALLDSWGYVHHAQGDVAGAEKLFKEALDLRVKAFGEGHSSLAGSYNNLSLCRRAAQDWAGAEEYGRKALESYELARGPRHPYTAIAVDNLGITFLSQGRMHDAEEMFRRALEIREQVYGPDHPETLDTVNNLASALDEQGRHAEAEVFFRQVVERAGRRSGGTHPDLAVFQNNLAKNLEVQYKYGEALEFQEKAYTLAQTQLGGQHPRVASFAFSMGQDLDELGRYAEAEPLLRQAVAIATRDSQAGQRLSYYQLGLARCLVEIKQFDEAELLVRTALAGRERELGPAHERTLVARTRLAEVLAARGHLEAAEKEFREILAARGSAPAAALAGSRDDLARFLLDAGRADEARVLWQQSLDTLDPGDAVHQNARVDAMIGLSLCARAKGDSAASESLAREAIAELEKHQPAPPRKLARAQAALSASIQQ